MDVQKLPSLPYPELKGLEDQLQNMKLCPTTGRFCLPCEFEPWEDVDVDQWVREIEPELRHRGCDVCYMLENELEKHTPEDPAYEKIAAAKEQIMAALRIRFAKPKPQVKKKRFVQQQFGQEMLLTGLVERADLNETAVVLLEFLPEKERWMTRHVLGGDILLVKPKNLE